MEKPYNDTMSHELKKVPQCEFCYAKKFEYEPPSFCCSNGEVVLMSTNVPNDLYELFTSQSALSVDLRRHLRAYNSIFSFTSFGVRLDKNLSNMKTGIYTFRAQGQVYHELPSLTLGDNGPCYLQLYFYDTDNELQNRMRILKDANLEEPIVVKLMEILSANPYEQFFRRLKDIPVQESYEIIIKNDVRLDQRVYNSPSSDQVAAVWIEGTNSNTRSERDIIVTAHSGRRHRVRHYFGCYDPLQYLLLFPFGEIGWHRNIKTRHQPYIVQHVTCEEDIFEHDIATRVEQARRTKKVSCRQYYCYKLQIREKERSILLYAGRLLQQYVVDMYIKLESTRLDYYRTQQSHIRSELYQGIVDSIVAGESRGDKVGKRVVLPASFIGGPRDMRRRYFDAMCLVQRFGKPDLFITMTCNPDWKEIRDELKFGQLPQDRPDLTARVFRAKLYDVKQQLFKRSIFGKVAAHVHVIEFQKRGLPHAHILLIFQSEFKITNAEQYDKLVCAEIPSENENPSLYRKVVKHMIHGPCGDLNKKNACMKDGKCKNLYPRKFVEHTIQGKDSYPIYRRRKDSQIVFVRNAMLDNRWVVPYNPYLLERYDCHINVEICSGITAVKYLYKYIYKGHDRVAIHISNVDGGNFVDEIKEYQDARWVSPQEAMWRLYEFNLNEMYPSVTNLQLHLPNKHTVWYWENKNLEYIIHSEDISRTMLTEFFHLNSISEISRDYLYREIPEHYVWNKQNKCWSPRHHKAVIGRVNAANPSEGERYYLRLLLNHVRGPTSYKDLLYVNGLQCVTFKESAERRGLLESDNSIVECLNDAVCFQIPMALRRLFATLIVFCDPSNVRKLWDDYFEAMSEDFLPDPNSSPDYQLMETLKSIENYLMSMGRNINDYDLPNIDYANDSNSYDSSREITNEMAIVTPSDDYNAIVNLNNEQENAYKTILECIISNQPNIFFIDGPEGTGKTYLYRALLAKVRSEHGIALATATFGVASSLLPGGRTSHSRFKIPIIADESTTCNISKQSSTAELLRKAKLIIWDEAPMAKRYAIEAVDRTLQDLLGNNLSFGGKVVVFGGDFRQVLPVLPRATRAEIIEASLVKSKLWKKMKKRLEKNMRARNDQSFTEFLLRVGNGEELTLLDNMIQLPKEIVINSIIEENSENALIDAIFPYLQENSHLAEYITNRAILATRNDFVDKINGQLIERFPGESSTYYSFDKANDDAETIFNMRNQCTFNTINSLDVLQRNWTIKVIVLRRGNVENYHNDKGSGQILKVILMDEEGTQIQAALFNDVVTIFKESLALHKTYIISNGIVSRVNHKYRNVHKEFELKFDKTISGNDIGALIMNSKSKAFDGAEKICLNKIIGKSKTAFMKTNYYFEATIQEIENEKKPWYDACMECNKKVKLLNSGIVCTNCNIKNVKCVQRFVMRLKVTDTNAEAKITVFDDCQSLINCCLEDLLRLKNEEEETNEFSDIVKRCEGKSFMFLVKIDNNNDELIRGLFVAQAVKKVGRDNDTTEELGTELNIDNDTTEELSTDNHPIAELRSPKRIKRSFQRKNIKIQNIDS
ncbi:uncharacterized protein LOC132314497 [Cornus florida]|uniref:uncharacterized protein LOC132314497 n=1 Tax=Cornus florida TaxID=4283 RepID=UPI002896BE1F|nr:uncharacterized protein LOC132314497 [Cornus florida]